MPTKQEAYARHYRHYMDCVPMEPPKDLDVPQILLALERAYNDLQHDSTSSKLANSFINTVNRFARYLGFKGSYQDRIAWGQRALKVAETREDKPAVAELCASTIAWPLLQLGDYDRAQEYCKRGLDAAIESNTPRWAGEASRILSGIARDRKQSDEAGMWARRAYGYARQCVPVDRYVKLLKRGAVMDFGYADLLKGKYRKAERRFRVLLEIYIREDDKERIANFYAGLAITLLNQGRIDEAEELYKKAEVLGQALNSQVIIAEAEFGLAKVAEARAIQLRSRARLRFDQLGITRPGRAEQFVDLRTYAVEGRMPLF